MPARSERIESIAAIENRRSEQAARSLADSQRLLDEQARLLERLEALRAEYASTEILSRVASTSAVAVQDYHVFLSRLDEAIQHQRELVAAASRECEQRREILRDSRRRALTLDKAVERFRVEENRQKSRLEQRELDDIGSGLHRGPRAASRR